MDTLTMTAIPIFDTHAHLDLDAFADDVDAAIRRVETGTFPEGFTPRELEGRRIEMSGVLLPGIDADSSRCCIELAAKSERFHAAVAIHPNSGDRLNDEAWRLIEEFARRPDVVAIGETGLDLYWDKTGLDVQIDFFRRHLELSRQTAKPVLIHCRDAWDEMLPVLRNFVAEETTAGRIPGVIHAFSGTPEQAEESVRLGFMVSFAGSLTYRNAKFSNLWEAAQVVPSDRLLIETDSPYMTPHPFRGKLQRNEPSMAVMVALRLAELRNESVEKIAAITTENACRTFRCDSANQPNASA